MSFSRLTRRDILTGMIVGGGVAALSACSAKVAATPVSTPLRTISLTDQRGATITFDSPVKRVVTIPMPAASLLVAVDQRADHLAGMHTASWQAAKDGVMGQMFPSLLTVPHEIATSDFTPNVESILALNPDVVVQWSDSALVAPLESAGLKVVGIKNNGTQDDVDAWGRLFATMLGKPSRARSMKTRSDKELAAVRGLSSSKAKGGPSILYFNRFTGGLKVAATNTYNDFWISLVGGTNPASGSAGVPGVGMVGVDVEQVLAWDPEVILLGNFDAARPDDLYSNPVYAGVSAVRSRRVYKVPLGGYRWDPPGQESPLMWHWLSSIAHPGSGSAHLRELMSSYYRLLYSYRLDAAQMDSILWTDVNDASAHYQQFDA